MPVKYRILPELSPQDIERFWSHVTIGSANECWTWNANLSPLETGYGRFYFKGTEYKAHRIAYYIQHRADLGNRHGCHRCDNPPCCNPAHIFTGSQSDNMDDMAAKKRRPCGEKSCRAKLSTAKVRAIRTRYVPHVVTMYDLADEFNVTPGAICDIIHRRTWKHLT